MTGRHAWEPEQVRAWIDDDPDPLTRDELSRLLDAALVGDGAARSELADRFSGLLQFGTAGLRGALGGGPQRMNRAVVIRAAAGLGAFLQAELSGPPTVAVGYDARHRSADFALDTAAVLTAAGARVLLLPRPMPTPVLAFTVRHLGADAGVMVTASHNPAADNGYKVYLGGRVVTGAGQGSQIVPPFDAAIAARIAAVPSVASVARADSGWQVLGEDVVDAYVGSVGALVAHDEPALARAGAVRIVLTPMHGVGGAVATRVLAEAGFTDVTLVGAQAQPDPDFPTVAFPNPEEPGALDLALALAREREADLVVALDPDADRCAVAVVDPRTGGWRALHGDETGALLGADAATRTAEGGTLAASIVSSRLLARIADAHGLAFAATLTGFKWISRVDGLVYGYEEALGYCVAPDLVRDKDGISAGLVVATLAARLKAEGRGLVDELDAIARRHGLYLTGQVAARFAEPAEIAAVVDRLRTAAPTELAGSPVTSVTDLSDGVDGLLPTEGFRLYTERDDRVVVRPSGTEPKVKCYLEVVVPLAPDASDEDVTAARTAARERLDALATDIRTALGLPTD